MSETKLKRGTWRKRGPRLYERLIPEPKQYAAYVFGAPSAQFWAYAVWGENHFEAEGVYFSFRRAKRKADEIIAKQMEVRANAE